jgi:hypothetical protein
VIQGVETSGALPPVQRSDCCRAGTSSGRAAVSLKRAGEKLLESKPASIRPLADELALPSVLARTK